jgi:hypothetical protein
VGTPASAPPGAPGAFPGSPPPSAKKRPKWLYIVGGIVLVVIVIGVLAAIFGKDDATDFEAGECTNDSLRGEITEIETVPCDDDHDIEAYGKFEADGDDFDEDDIQSQAEEECTGDLFEDYVGTSYSDSIYLVDYLPPTEDTWDSGYHDVLCYIHDTTDGTDLDHPAQDSEE